MCAEGVEGAELKGLPKKPVMVIVAMKLKKTRKNFGVLKRLKRFPKKLLSRLS